MENEQKVVNESEEQAEGTTIGETAEQCPTDRLEALFEEARRDKKWSSVTISRAEGLFTEVVRGESTETIAAFSLELHLGVFETVFRQHWHKLNNADKAGVIAALLKIRNEKGYAKQIVLGDILARSDDKTDRSFAVDLLCGAIQPNPKKNSVWPKLQKTKVELLQRRFLFSLSGWPLFELSDTEKARILLMGFAEAADDPHMIRDAKSRSSLYSFARWAAGILREVLQDDPENEPIKQRILSIGSSIPEWENQVNPAQRHRVASQEGEANSKAVPCMELARSDAALIEVLPLQPDDAAVDVAAQDLSNKIEVAGYTQTSQHAEETSRTVTLGSTPISDVLPKDPVSMLRHGLESLQAGISMVDNLNAELQRLAIEKQRVDDELRLAQTQIAGLKSANFDLGHEVKRFAQDKDDARSELEQARIALAEFTQQLADEREGRAEDEKRFAEQIEREKRFVLDGFKGKLRSSLGPIFDNKRSTDDHELSPALAGFLRRWLNEIEEKLKTSGIQL